MSRDTFDYTASKKVGKIVGPVLSALFLSELVTLHIYRTPISAHVVYLNGFMLLVFGAYLVSRHNVWTTKWPLLITLSAWSMVALGLYRLFLPEAPQAPVNTTTYASLSLFLVIELFVTIKSFKR